MKLEGKSIIVTGASSGMGKAIVELFAREGAEIIAVARREERLNKLKNDLSGCKGRVVPLVGDVAETETAADAVNAAVANFGKLDVLINNAGVMDDMSPIGSVTDENIERVFGINLLAPIFFMREAVKHFEKRGEGGNIINISSLGAMKTCAGAVYSASKAAVVSLTKNTAFMYMPQGIRCNAIAPGGIRTEIGGSMGIPNVQGYDRVKLVLNTAPAPGAPEQVASTALFLASDESAYINGDVILVDGGWASG